MRVVPFTVPHIAREAFRWQEDRVPHFYDQLHQHPETQIMLILKSEGTLIAGDYVGRFAPGDVFLIGSGQPHVFRNDEVHYREGTSEAHAISLYFREEYAGQDFWQLEEMTSIRLFLAKADKGFKLAGPERMDVYKRLLDLHKLQGLEKLISFLTILKIFATSENLTPLAVTSHPRHYSATEEKRMNDIIHFTFRESHRKISIHEVAQIANLSDEAFCRYFKSRTLKTYSGFLNEVRISNACKLLITGQESIEQVCYQAGFNNLSHFNRTFKKITGKTPSSYTKPKSRQR
jgi:AraC-like DNA-binding protein